MKTFLQELADDIYAANRNSLDTLTLVFPNRRATLYFRKHLSAVLDKPAFSPTLTTVEDFIAQYSPWKIPDKLELVHRLHAVYAEIMSITMDQAARETFEQFYFWGDMLLRDFEEIDKYMVDATFLFKDLSQQKEIDSLFDFLTEEQIDFLKSFWLNFDERESANKKKFLFLWRKLPEVFAAFKKDLSDSGLAYEGMLQRSVAERFKSGELSGSVNKKKIAFVGFNALTKAEETIISTLVNDGVATVHWDIDAYYMLDHTQEAGKFFREYNQHPVLGKTFPADTPSNFLKHLRKDETGTAVVHLYGASQSVGQAKMAAQVLEEQLQRGIRPEETVFVLPDEKMLMPVLHSIAGPVEKLNVTMGFPLSSTPLFNLVELLIELQVMKKDGEFNHRPVTSLLGHPYIVAADAAVAKSKTKDILSKNRVSISAGELSAGVPLHQLIFKDVTAETSAAFTRHVIHYLRDIIRELGALSSIPSIDKEYCFHFLKLLNRMEEVVGNAPSSEADFTSRSQRQSLKSFLRLFRQLIRAERIPFRGEPLRGLQVMGVLETRNLDFKNVFVLSLNEGAFPAFSSKGSYIPHNIRKAYQLPTADYQDAMYAYLFYRVLQRAENVFLFYTTETDDLGEGEMSRYLQQLLYEANVKNKKFVLHNPLRPAGIEKITVTKDASVFQSLSRFLAGSTETKNLSPSAINDYIECRLKFYFKHVALIREAKEVEDDLGPKVLGNILHGVMEFFYTDLIAAKKNSAIEVNDYVDAEKKIELLIDRVFREEYKLDPDKPVEYEGQRVVVREVVKRFAHEIIRKDKAYAPFEMIGLESDEQTYAIRLALEGNPEVQLGGYIDRADRKGDAVRVIDYKTGKDELGFKGEVKDLMSREGERNKAAFQTMLYALLFYKNPKQFAGKVRIIPGLMNRLNLFEQNFKFGLTRDKAVVDDATPLLPEFEEHLTLLLNEMFDPAVPFDQTENTDACKWCPYREICCR